MATTTSANLPSYNAVDREYYVNLEKNFKEIRSKWRSNSGGPEHGKPNDVLAADMPSCQTHIYPALNKTIESYWTIMTPMCNNVDATQALLNECHQNILRREIVCVTDFCARCPFEKENERKVELEQLLADEFKRAQLILEYCLEDFKAQMEATIQEAVTVYRQLMDKEMLTLIQGPDITVDKLNGTHEKIVLQLTPSTDSTNRDWIKSEIRKRTVSDFLAFKEVVESMIKYNGFMRRQFDLYTCLSADKYNEFSNNCIKIITQSFERKNKDKEREKENNELLGLGLKQLAQTAQTKNKEIYEHEVKQAEYAKERIVAFYNCEMKSRVETTTFTRPNLRNIHEKLMSDCILTIKRVCNLHEVSGIPDQEKVLREELDKSFTNYVKTNDSKLKESLRDLYAVVRKLKDVFVARMKDKLKESQSSVLHFILHRADIFEEVSRILEIEIARYPHESYEFYKQTLKYLVDMELPRLQAENDNSLNSNKEKPTTSQDPKPMVKSEEQNNLTNEELANLKPEFEEKQKLEEKPKREIEEKQTRELELFKEKQKQEIEEQQKRVEREANKKEAERIMQIRRDKWRRDEQSRLQRSQSVEQLNANSGPQNKEGASNLNQRRSDNPSSNSGLSVYNILNEPELDSTFWPCQLSTWSSVPQVHHHHINKPSSSSNPHKPDQTTVLVNASDNLDESNETESERLNPLNTTIGRYSASSSYIISGDLIKM